MFYHSIKKYYKFIGIFLTPIYVIYKLMLFMYTYILGKIPDSDFPFTNLFEIFFLHNFLSSLFVY